MANPDGTPIWFELTTDDQDKAQGFYEKVAGWSVDASQFAEHGGYRIASAADGQGVAGLMTPPPGMGGTPGWSLYFAASDVDAMAETVKSLGGQVHAGPMDIPHVGRFAVVADPQGVVFQIMKGDSPEDSQAFKQAGESGGGIGHAVWIELATPDPDAAIAFYGGLFGWSKQGAMPMPVLSDAAGGVEGGDMGEYAFIGSADFRPGAVMSSAATGAPARWNWYVHVPDIDIAVATAKDNGGALLQGPDPIPGGDFSANITDAQGYQVGLVGSRK